MVSDFVSNVLVATENTLSKLWIQMYRFVSTSFMSKNHITNEKFFLYYNPKVKMVSSFGDGS